MTEKVNTVSRTRKEIVDKEAEIYDLAKKGKISIVGAILYADALEWVLGEDYLDFDDLKGEKDDK